MKKYNNINVMIIITTKHNIICISNVVLYKVTKKNESNCKI
jgi:hypothetical protein